MKKTFLASVATLALIGANGIAFAQSPAEKQSAPAAQSAPVEKAAPAENMAPQINRSEAPSAKPENGTKGGNAQAAPADKGNMQRAQDTKTDGMQPKSSVSEQKSDMKPGGKTSADMKAGTATSEKSASEMNADRSKDGVKTETKTGAETKQSTTTGQAAAGSKQLSTEQRTTIRTVIKEQNIRPAQNINFSITIGTHVPRTVGFHPLPPQLVTIYPDWRGYEFFLVGDQIIVVNPRTFEIVAVLEA